MEQTPPPYVPASDEAQHNAAPETPMFGSTATRTTDEAPRPTIEDTFLNFSRPSFWD